MLNHVSFADNSEWHDLLSAISSGGGGGGGSPISIDSTQWQDLLDEVEKGDTTALTTLLTTISGTLAQIKIALDAVVIDSTQWNALITAISSSIVTADVTQNSTQWGNLINAFSSVGIEQDTTQFNALINAIQSQQSVVVEQEPTQFNALINAISNINQVFNTEKIIGTDTSGHLTATNISVSDFNQLFTIPLHTEIGTLFDVDIWKQGGQKHIEFNGSVKSAISTGWQTSGITLPTIYRPTYQINRGYMVRQGSNNIYITLAVTTSGDIQINTTTALNVGTALRVAIDYI